MEKQTKMGNLREKVAGIACSTVIVLAVGGVAYGLCHSLNKGFHQAIRPVRVEFVDVNNDGQPDLSVLNQRGDEYVLYGNCSEEGSWLDEMYRNDLERLAKSSDKTPRYKEGINVNQTLGGQLYDSIGKKISGSKGLEKSMLKILTYSGDYESRYLKNKQK